MELTQIRFHMIFCGSWQNNNTISIEKIMVKHIKEIFEKKWTNNRINYSVNI